MDDHSRGNGIGAYRSCIIVLLLILALTPSATAADTMFRANAEHTGVFDNGSIVPTNTELWRFKTGNSVGSSPIVSNDVVFVGSWDNNLYAIDALTGNEKWRFVTSREVVSSPAISNGVVYIGSLDNNLYAIDAETGKERWRFWTNSGVSSSPSVSNGVVYIGSDDKHEPWRTSRGKLYAIDTATGTEKWRFETGGSVYSSPAVSNGVVYVGSGDNNLYAIDALTGKERWRFVTGSAVFGSPAVSTDVVYVGSGDNNLYAIDALTGKEKWRFVTGSAVSGSPAVSDGVVYVGSIILYAIDVEMGKERWRFLTESYAHSPSVSNGIVYVGSDDKNLYAIDTLTGKEKWRYKTNGTVISSPAVSNGVVYIGSSDKNLYAIGGAPAPVPTTRSPTPVPTTQQQGFDSSDPYGLIILLIIGLVVAGGGYVGYSKIIRSKKEKLPSPPTFTRQKEKVTEPIPDTIQLRTEQTILNQINKIRNNPAVSSSTKSELNTLANTIHGINLAENEHPLKTYAEKQLDLINKNLHRIGQKGAVFTRSPDNIRQMINAEKYGEAIVESDKFLSNLVQVEEIYDKATAYRTAMPDPDIVSLYNAGNYASVIKVYEEKQAKIDQENKLRKRVEQLNEAAEKVGSVPDSIKNNLQTHDIRILEKTINDLDSFITNTKPELVFNLAETRLIVDNWHKVELTITNVGDAHVSNVQLTFTDDFETRWITPVSVKAKESMTLNIGIKPKTQGKIPLEVSLSYMDYHRKEYKEISKFWIDVIGKEAFEPSKTPSSSPVDRFTPKPLTPKQLPPDLSERYTEWEFIGKGGFARVFKAKRTDGQYVAVKIPISLDAMTGKSFIAEMQNWTKLSHPNIVRLYDFNIMPMPYFEMELCDSSLADRKKPIEIVEAAWLLFNVCEGLKFTHANKIIHRDLKPQNILLKKGVPKISDWGLSRVISESTTTTTTSFTPYYAAPEQISSEKKDERTDIWQLGVIFYELVTGQLPFTGDSMVAIMAAIASKNPQPPSSINLTSHDVESMIMKCLEKNPSKRYQSVLEFQKDLALYLRITYTESLKISVPANDLRRSAYYCGDLVMVNLLIGDLVSANKYLLDLVHYSNGDVKVQAQELSEQIKMRMEMGLSEIPDELIQKAEIIVHQVNIGSDNKMTAGKIIQNNRREIENTKVRGSLTGKCPLCGSNLVWRQAKKTGEMYKGCTNFDGGCRYQERSY